MVEILIVEDDPNIARTIEVTISLVGYECRICGDGAELDWDLIEKSCRSYRKLEYKG